MNKKADVSIAYFGTPRFSVHVLNALAEAGMAPDIVVTQPDRPAGRGLALQESPVKTWSLERDIPVIHHDDLSVLKNSEIDLYVLAAYGQILKDDILSLPAHGTLNVHPSLLPRFRGPSPIESQILEDENECGVSIIKLDAELDHGPIVAQASITPDPWPMRTRDLEDLLWTEGGRLLAEVIPPYLAGEITPEPQDHAKATFTKKMAKEDGLLDLAGDGYQNYLKFCAYDEWPGTYFFALRAGKQVRVKITDAVYTDGVFTPLRVVPEGKKEMDYQDFARNL